MKYKPIVIVAGEPNSIFSELFLKTLQRKSFKSPIILICSKKHLIKQALFLKRKIKFNDIDKKLILKKNFKYKKLNLINVDYEQQKPFDKISSKSNKYIEKCFDIALELMECKISNKLINGPISKEKFLRKKFLGITEYLALKTNTKNFAMIIYNKKLSVSPITTHLPLKYVSKRLNKSDIINKIKLINFFWRKIFKKKLKIGITGLNPHCESIDKFKEDKKIIQVAVNKLKKSNINIKGPLAADTIFLKNNRKNLDLIVGMYHDQVLTPMKTLFEYDAINITVGLPFIRISPDHGPNEQMLGKNKSNPTSLIRAISFLDKN
tara:strand:- start:653 stop:1618 length:966 start_codon:yes stop_codon:yes gene_type:complete